MLKQALREAVEQEKDILLCDTSGRLHTNWALMEELSKVERELGRVLIGAPHEVLLVLDGSTGLNMMNQVLQHHYSLEHSFGFVCRPCMLFTFFHWKPQVCSGQLRVCMFALAAFVPNKTCFCLLPQSVALQRLSASCTLRPYGLPACIMAPYSHAVVFSA